MNGLMRLMAENRGRGFFRAEKSSDDDASVYLYDVIVSDDYFGGVSAMSFVKELNSIKAKTIHLRINSPGGDVFAARAIEQSIREHPSRIVTHIDGYAASAASFVALAGDEVIISESGFIMIHKAWTVAFGNSDDFVETASLLERVDKTLVDTYAKKTGRSAEEIAEWMSNETWFTAQDAVDYGFADRVSEVAQKVNAKWNLSAYAHAPEEQEARSCMNTDHLSRKLRLIAHT